jgi:hypothetical protein
MLKKRIKRKMKMLKNMMVKKINTRPLLDGSEGVELVHDGVGVALDEGELILAVAGDRTAQVLQANLGPSTAHRCTLHTTAHCTPPHTTHCPPPRP